MSVFFIFKSQTAGTEEQSPAAAGSQAPGLPEVLGRCSHNSRVAQATGSLGVHCRGKVSQESKDRGWGQAQLVPQAVCFLNVLAWTLLEQPSLWSACMQGSTAATLGSPSSFPSAPTPLPALGCPLQALLVPLQHCEWGHPHPFSPTTQHHVSKQLTQAWRVRSGEWRRGEGKTEGISIKSGPSGQEA